MRNKFSDAAKGDAAMTDFQFKAYIELRDKYDVVVRELELLRQKSEFQKEVKTAENSMSDYQFQRYEKLRDKNEEMANEITLLREENAKLKVQAEMLKSLSNDKKKKKA